MVKKAQKAYENVLASTSFADGMYDLGRSVYFEAMILLMSRGHGAGIMPTRFFLDVKVKGILGKAAKFFGDGIKLDPFHSGCWNGLGLCLLDDQAKSCCFARATQLDGNTFAFCNLAMDHLHHSRFTLAKDCYGEIQSKDSNPNIWVGLGVMFEMTASQDTYKRNMQMASDAYEAAMEVAKPVEALLASAVSYLTVKGYLTPDLTLRTPRDFGYSNYCYKCEKIDLKHIVEFRIRAYLHRCPIHPFAWSILAWVLEELECYLDAISAHKSGLEAVRVIKSYVESSDFRCVPMFPLLHVFSFCFNFTPHVFLLLRYSDVIRSLGEEAPSSFFERLDEFEGSFVLGVSKCDVKLKELESSEHDVPDTAKMPEVDATLSYEEVIAMIQHDIISRRDHYDRHAPLII